MPRTAFVMEIKPGTEEEYVKRHQVVYPELLAALKRVGIRNYSIYMHGRQLFAYLEADDFAKAWSELATDPANIRWQEFMDPLFIKDAGGNYLKLIPEVFHLD